MGSVTAGERRLVAATAALCALGLLVAGYLSVTEASGELPQCVAGSSGCATVATSDYAELAGIPVAYLGLAGYLGIAATLLLRGDPGRLTGVFLALVGFGFSAYLTYIELDVIDAICQYCVVSAILMTLLLAVTSWRLIAFAGSDPTSLEP
jgi:uncharacterized membrane protein